MGAQTGDRLLFAGVGVNSATWRNATISWIREARVYPLHKQGPPESPPARRIIVPPSLLVSVLKGWPGSVPAYAPPASASSPQYSARRMVWSPLRASTEHRP